MILASESRFFVSETFRLQFRSSTVWKSKDQTQSQSRRRHGDFSVAFASCRHVHQPGQLAARCQCHRCVAGEPLRGLRDVLDLIDEAVERTRRRGTGLAGAHGGACPTLAQPEWVSPPKVTVTMRSLRGGGERKQGAWGRSMAPPGAVKRSKEI